MLAGHWQDFKVENHSAAQTAALVSTWNALSQSSLEPAGFNAPQLMIPILEHLDGAKLVTVSHGPDLVMAMPLKSKRTLVTNWVTPLTASGTPHVADGLAEATIQAFLQAQTKPVLFTAIPSDGKFATTLQKQSANYAVLETWQRAGLKTEGGFENWQQSNFDHKRRKEFKRQRNRLSEQGALVTEALQAGQDAKPFIDDLLALEASGWKGQKGTAINANAKLATALYEAATALHTAGKLRFWSMKLDGKAIATLFAIVEGPHAWLGKIAYDETYAKFSPGALIILDCTESFFAEPSITQIDSSAIPDHPLIDRIWRDRLPMTSVFVASDNISALHFKSVVCAEKTRLRMRSFIRDLYYKLKGDRRS
jgi:CelD/BcsL family acetyltransferase involved in cellulose biosynthesis